MAMQEVRVVRVERIVDGNERPTDEYGVTFAFKGYASKITIPVPEHVDDEARIRLARARLHDLLKRLSSETSAWALSPEDQNQIETEYAPIRRMPGQEP